jgi:hypothetical protein
MICLPKMGRPSVSGLHSSRMTHAGYMSAWRAQGLNAAGKPKKADNGRTLRK